MQDKLLFEYAVIRLVPSVEREEFLNVGVILYCQDENFLRVSFDLNKERLSSFGCDLEVDEITEHLRAFERISLGGDSAGAIGSMPIGARFRWLTAPRSTIVQTSAVHTGLTRDADATLTQLLKKMVC